MKKDKTSAALYNLVRTALNNMDMLPPEFVHIHGEAQVDHNLKLSLLQHAFDIGGSNVILSIGQTIIDDGANPVIVVLLKARSAMQVVKRWQRLEQFYHSRHRTKTISEGVNQLTIKHWSLEGEAPGYLEDLLIAGIMYAFLQSLGCIQLTMHLGDGTALHDGEKFCLEKNESESDYSTWNISWDHQQHLPPLLQAARGGSLEERLKYIFSTDPASSWTIDQFLIHCDFSRRTLQRKLKAEQASLQVLLREFRANYAFEMIMNSNYSLTHIAFASGYSDQAHFNREFKRCIGLPPGNYRKTMK
ncbi:MAG: helix-turn-helix transcriptional regulator [Pseudomonadales bacterium]|nr:helix-turn-helix transcriptional regulator [Pseudomonadales bacterium]